MGVCRLALQFLTLFPSNTNEVKVKVNGVGGGGNVPFIRKVRVLFFLV